jgi:hypothetical protein
MEDDFFLQYSKTEFLEHARMMIFETYCRLHETIDIAMLSDKLSMTQEDSEKWIVDLIRNAEFDAKIDSKENHVIMSKQFPSIYQEIINKTKDLGAKSHGLATNIDRCAACLHLHPLSRQKKEITLPFAKLCLCFVPAVLVLPVTYTSLRTILLTGIERVRV